VPDPLRAQQIDVEMGRETFVDPRDGKTSLGEWVDIWAATHQAAPATWAAYRGHLRCTSCPGWATCSFNPCRGVPVATSSRPERPHATTQQVAAIAARMRRPIDGLMVVTAAYTGMRWGELAGLDRDNVDLDRASIYVHPEVGALAEHDVRADADSVMRALGAFL
jgi:integrase